MDGEYKIGKTQDPQKVRDFVKANMNGDLEGEVIVETDAEDYQAAEDVFAFYGQSTTYFDKFMLLFGARYEITKIDYTGYEVQWDVDGDYVGTTEATNSKTWMRLSDPISYVQMVKEWLDLGADIIGGCCGTTPDHIAAMKEVLRKTWRECNHVGTFFAFCEDIRADCCWDRGRSLLQPWSSRKRSESAFAVGRAPGDETGPLL